MTRTAALRASVLFVVLTIVFGAIGLGSHAVAAEAMFVITASLGAVMLLFAVAMPVHRAVPVRVRKVRAYR